MGFVSEICDNGLDLRGIHAAWVNLYRRGSRAQCDLGMTHPIDICECALHASRATTA